MGDGYHESQERPWIEYLPNFESISGDAKPARISIKDIGTCRFLENWRVLRTDFLVRGLELLLQMRFAILLPVLNRERLASFRHRTRGEAHRITAVYILHWSIRDSAGRSSISVR